LVADKCNVEAPFRCFAPVPDPGDSRQVPDERFDPGVDQPGNLGSKHPGRNPEVAAHVVRVDVPDQVLVDGRIVLFQAEDGIRDVVDACDLVGRFVLLGGTVVGEDYKGHLLAEPGVVLEREIQVPGYILDL